MARFRRHWLGIALAAVGSALTLTSLWLMPTWVACLLAGALTLGLAYRLLAYCPLVAVTPPEREPTPQPSVPTPVAAPGPLVMNVSTYQDGHHMGQKQIPIQVSAHVPR